MSRKGFTCDGCGEEDPYDEPAAVVKDIDGGWDELCEGCYAEYREVRA